MDRRAFMQQSILAGMGVTAVVTGPPSQDKFNPRRLK